MSDEYYEIQAVLSEYAGNHERELTYWVFGAMSDYPPGGWEPPERPHAPSMEWADGGEMEGTLERFPHEEYGLVWQTIGDDPEWLKDHMNPPQYGRMVYWRFAEPPTDEQWEALKAALDTYEPQPQFTRPMPKVTVEKLSLVRVVTTREVRRSETP